MDPVMEFFYPPGGNGSTGQKSKDFTVTLYPRQASAGTLREIHLYVNASADSEAVAAVVPEPLTWALCGAGLVLIGAVRTRTGRSIRH